MFSLTVDKTWKYDTVEINRSWEVDFNGKKHNPIYSVDEIDGDNINCFKTLKDAKKCVKEYLKYNN